MHLIINFNEGIWFLLCVVDIYIKYTWVNPLKDKKGITVTNGFQKMLNEINRRETKSKGGKPKKYGLRKAANFIIDQWNHGSKKMT